MVKVQYSVIYIQGLGYFVKLTVGNKKKKRKAAKKVAIVNGLQTAVFDNADLARNC